MISGNDLHITPKSVFVNRRAFIEKALISLGGSAFTMMGMSVGSSVASTAKGLHSQVTDKKLSTRYNNYYEFSTDKKAVAFLAKELTLSPWKLKISGEVRKPMTIDAEELHQNAIKRTYRFRCVEGWSMVVPWLGTPLVDLLALVEPTENAKFVIFKSIFRPSEMIGQRHATLEWPYTEALRIDEAMHPLTLMATGMYDEPMPAQNGAPVRLIVPWKYGFKSIKAVEEIIVTDKQPVTTWMKAAPSEYGFYANVKPDIPHPRWSQRREVRLGETKKLRRLILMDTQTKSLIYMMAWI